ncbi:hypothetical protein NDU88_003757 [Pleurodeles waltl]|uniref:Uncharacterized protein n=1 Tax=Pleurodeles waltl TaxID=8319 RepID=A0AAV7NMD3_PLEWA|nr:hypothetical protein NDU88_003757 [Pleurodeles waltl]
MRTGQRVARGTRGRKAGDPFVPCGGHGARGGTAGVAGTLTLHSSGGLIAVGVPSLEGAEAGVEPLDGRPRGLFWNYWVGPLAKATPRKRRVRAGMCRRCRVLEHALAHTWHEHRVSTGRRGAGGTGAWMRTVGHRSAFVANVMLCRLLPLLQVWWFASVGNKTLTQY